MDRAVIVVRNDDCFRTVADCVVALLGEGESAAVDDDDLAGEGDCAVDCGEVFRGAVCVDIDVVIGAGDRVDRGIGICVAVAVLGGLGIEDLPAAVKDQRHAGRQRVLRRRDAETVDVGARRTAGMEVHVLRIQLMARKGVGRVGVARRDRNDHMIVEHIVHQIVQRLLIGGVRIGEAGGGGTERQVDRVRAQIDRVFDRRKVVRLGCARMCRAEDLHDEDLRVGRHADRADGLRRVDVAGTALDKAVCRRDTGDVGTVVARRIVLMIHRGVAVDVVECERDLCVQIRLGRGQRSQALLRVQLIQRVVVDLLHQRDRFAGLSDRVLERIRVHALMIGVETGVDDRDSAACAGVAELLPGVHGADHIFAGVRRVRVRRNGLRRFVPVFDLNGLDARDPADHGKIPIGDLNGDRVCQQRQVPFHGQLVTDRLFDRCLHRILLLLQGFAVRLRAFVVGDASGGEAVFDGGIVFEEDRYAHDLIRRKRILGQKPF